MDNRHFNKNDKLIDRVCTICGETFSGLRQRKYCDKCLADKYAVREARRNDRLQHPGMSVCEQCGALFADERGKRRLCRACYDERVKARYVKPDRRDALGFCRCGEILDIGDRALCSRCREGDKPDHKCEYCGGKAQNGRRFCVQCERIYQRTVQKLILKIGEVPHHTEIVDDPLFKATVRQHAKNISIKGEVLVRLAQRYRYPYNSYGRLRAYIDEFGELPPESWLIPVVRDRVTKIAYIEIRDEHAMDDVCRIVRRQAK